MGETPKTTANKTTTNSWGASRATKQIQEVGINFTWPLGDIMKVFSARVRSWILQILERAQDLGEEEPSSAIILYWRMPWYLFFHSEFYIDCLESGF